MDRNRDEARKCLNLAISAFNHRQLDKAWKCVKKAEQLYPTCETKVVKNIILAHLRNTQKAHAKNPPSGYNNQARRGSRPLETKYAPPEYTAEQLEAVRRVRNCRNHYDILMLTKEATTCDIKKAYKKLALILHPDKNKAPCADEAFKTLVNAVTILTDPDQRMLYDFRTFRLNPTNVKNTPEQQRQYPRGHERQYHQRYFCDCCCCINPHLRCKQCRCCYRHYMSQATSNCRPKNRSRPNPFYNS